MSYYHGEQRQPDPNAMTTTTTTATRSIRNPNNLTLTKSAGPAPLQGFREDYHGHGDVDIHEDEFDADADADGSDDEVAQALRGQGEHMYHYAATPAAGLEGDQDQHYYDDRDYSGMGGGQDERIIHGQDDDIDDEQDEEEEEDDVAGEFSDSLSSSPSIPDDDIDFNLVYALHTFLATVDGQASVVKGDKLLLLDDSNSYWWLVRVLKTQAIGYIPAENIETPWERLARLNKHRNVDLTTATQHDVLTGPTSSSAQTRFAGRIPPSEQPHPHESRHPYSKGVPASPSHKDHPRNISPPPPPFNGMDADEYGGDGREGVARPPSSKAKTVLFTAPTYYAHSATGMTSEDEEPEEGYYEEGSGDEMELEEEHEHDHVEGDELRRDDDVDNDGRPAFKDDDFVGDHDHDHDVDGGGATYAHRHEHDADIEDADQQDDDSTTLVLGRPVAATSSATAAASSSVRSGLPAALVPGGGAGAHAGQMVLESEPASIRESRTPLADVNERQLDSSSAVAANGPAGLGIGLGGGGAGGSFDRSHATASTSLGKDASSASAPTAPTTTSTLTREFNENELLDPEAPTKKLSATPAIAREINRGPVSSGTASASSAPAPNPFGPDLTTSADRPKRTIRGVEVVDPRDPRYNRMLQPTKQAGEDLVYERVVADAQRQQQQYHEQQYQLQQRRQMQQQQQQQQAALGNAAPNSGPAHYETPDLHDEDGADALGDSTNSQRASLSDAGSGSEKKRKSGGGILGLFRKKDKKKKGTVTTEDDAGGKAGRRPSDESLRSSTSSGGAAFRRSSSGSPSGFRSSSDRPPSGSRSSGAGGSASTAESMFSTDAALRQQELEAKQALYQQYGVTRGPGDVSNTMTPRGMPGGLVMNQSGQQQHQRDASPGPQSRLAASGSSISNRNSLSLLSHPASMLGASTGMAAGSALNSPNSLAPPQRTRPGSLVGSPVVSGGVEVPLLSVMRVFAGENVDSDATFKTVLLNQSTSSAELVKQAMQRFRLTAPHLRPDEFYLTVKELGGDERPLDAEERPLEIFEDLSERIGDEGLALPPNVKRSSIGSINSISSNLTLNPAITRSGVGDWSDDSAVKFYLHRRQPAQLASSLDLDRSHGSDAASRSTSEHGDVSLNSSGGSGPSYRFAVRLILPDEELPEHLAFDPLSEAVIPKTLLAERRQRVTEGNAKNGPRQRIIFFPRNANVSEVVETALDRFGIADGVVDGGDEVEDRVTRRRSSNRIKYILAVEREGQESFLSSSSKLLDAYSVPPAFKAYDRSSREFRRRSADAGLILGLSSDVLPTDPVFVIRRSPHRSSGSRGALPQTVDELDDLRQRRRVSSDGMRGSPRTSDSGARPSPRELIAAQRAASQANQRALLSGPRQDDLTSHSQTTLRADEPSADDIRYSILSEDSTVDAGIRPEALQGLGLRPTDNLSRGVSAAESFQTAQTSLERTPLASPGVDGDDEAAIARLRAAQIGVSSGEATSAASTVGAPRSMSASPRPLSPTGLEKSLQERLDRVLARVREDKARRAASPPPPAGQRPQSYIDTSGAGVSGRFSPVNVATRSASALGGRRSPFGDKLSDSPSIVGQLMSSPPRRSVSSEHPAQIKKGSVTSMSSTGSTATGTDQLSTPIASSNAHSIGYTPASSATGNHRAPLVYPDDYGYDFLAAVVNAGARSSAVRRRPEPRAFYERSPDILGDAHPEVRQTYGESARALNDIETRLDQLLVRLVNV